jgi:hypothetical protein
MMAVKNVVLKSKKTKQQDRLLGNSNSFTSNKSWTCGNDSVAISLSVLIRYYFNFLMARPAMTPPAKES